MITHLIYVGNKQTTLQNNLNPNIRGVRQEEAIRREYKRLTLGGGQAYDCRSGVVKSVKA
jgi:hypothetical protein